MEKTKFLTERDELFAQANKLRVERMKFLVKTDEILVKAEKLLVKANELRIQMDEILIKVEEASSSACCLTSKPSSGDLVGGS